MMTVKHEQRSSSTRSTHPRRRSMIPSLTSDSPTTESCQAHYTANSSTAEMLTPSNCKPVPLAGTVEGIVCSTSTWIVHPHPGAGQHAQQCGLIVSALTAQD